MMKAANWLMLASWTISGCSNPNFYHEAPPPIRYPIMNSTHEYQGSMIDHTIDELSQQNGRIDQSIVPNEADKVYNQRFINDLERMRDKACRQKID